MQKLLDVKKDIAPRLLVVDTMILQLLKARMDLCLEVEADKHEHQDSPIVDVGREKDRIAYATQWALDNGLSPELARAVMYIVINESCHAQMVQRQVGKRPVFQPKSEEEWRSWLKENLVTLTAQWSPSYDTDYAKGAFATRTYLAVEEEQLISQLSQIIGRPSGRRELLVDLGCATGRGSLPLASYFERVVGYDISPHMIEAANKKLAGTPLAKKVSYVEHDIETGIPLKDGVADMVMMNLGTASDVPDLPGVFKEIMRVLMPGGRFFLSFYNKEALLYKTAFIPWPVSLTASISAHKDCLDVHSGTEVLSVYARRYGVDEVRAMLHGVATDLGFATYPTFSAVMPNVILNGAFGIHSGVEIYDRQLMHSDENPGGAYIMASGKKPL